MDDYNSFHTSEVSAKATRKSLNHITIGLILYEILLLWIVTADSFIRYFFYEIKSALDPVNGLTAEEILGQIEKQGMSSIIAVTIGIIFLYGFFWNSDSRKQLFIKTKQMNAKSFIMLFFLFMSAQLFANLFGSGTEWFLNQFGYSVLNEIKNASDASETFSMILYSAIAAPFTEEILFRGYVLKGLQKTGKWYAVFMSALLFGAFHGNFVQGAYAFVAGLALGYVAVEYSIWWSIILHVMNNFIFGDLFSYLTEGLSTQTGNMVSLIFNIMILSATLMILIIKRKRLIQIFRELHFTKNKWIGTFTAVAFLLFLLLMFYLAAIGVEPLDSSLKR